MPLGTTMFVTRNEREPTMSSEASLEDNKGSSKDFDAGGSGHRLLCYLYRGALKVLLVPLLSSQLCSLKTLHAVTSGSVVVHKVVVTDKLAYYFIVMTVLGARGAGSSGAFAALPVVVNKRVIGSG
eukprot:Nk52_evm8s2011 gene=Nk52_evmTU8s2011